MSEQSLPGKTVANHTYLHVSLLNALPASTQQTVNTAAALAGVMLGEACNVIKLAVDPCHVSLLDYPGFFDEAFPTLRRYWTVDLGKAIARFRTYEQSLNPPILHRKELLLPEDHPERQTYMALTVAAEQLGLFDDPCRIGFKQAWDALLAGRGYRVVAHQLLPLGNDESVGQQVSFPTAVMGIARHLTALTRYGLSAPIQSLLRFSVLDGSKALFDYGCGRGDDVRRLRENGIAANGWDPYYAPDEPKIHAPIVNLGFVINVIEELKERIVALRGAFSLADEMLVVSTMLANPATGRGIPYADGILTSRGTFQKYYTQGELCAFIATVLDQEPLPIGPGICYVFKDKEAEQRFMMSRQENRRNVLCLHHLSRPALPSPVARAEVKYLAHRDLLDALWEICLQLGRDPDQTEVPQSAKLIEHFGSLPAALRFIKSRQGEAATLMDEARASRIADLQVYFAQLQFEQRKPYRHLEARLQRDVRTFFGDYAAALNAGRALLFAAGDNEAIAVACREAAERGIGWLEEGESLQLPTGLVVQLPAILRTYLGCGLQLYGDPGSADLIKIHIRSGKLTLMTFDDFVGKPLPRLLRRVKIKLRQQELDVFDYGVAYLPPYLYRKSRFINEEFPNYAEQLAFDEHLDSLGLFDVDGYGPPPGQFDAQLEAARWVIDGFRLYRSRTIPDLDAPCGRYLTYRQLIECGETQARTGLANLPREPDSYTALYELVSNILDPIIEYFGMIKLTYGFCSPALARQISARLAPTLDQHAAHEQKRNGNPICERLGAACDFLVEDEDMEEVALWVATETPFDRLYYYGADQPIHVSYGPNHSRTFVDMVESPAGRLLPRVRRTLKGI